MSYQDKMNEASLPEIDIDNPARVSIVVMVNLQLENRTPIPIQEIMEFYSDVGEIFKFVYGESWCNDHRQECEIIKMVTVSGIFEIKYVKHTFLVGIDAALLSNVSAVPLDRVQRLEYFLNVDRKLQRIFYGIVNEYDDVGDGIGSQVTFVSSGSTIVIKRL